MGRMIISVAIFMTVAIFGGKGQKKEGDSCVNEYTSTTGTCTPSDKCQSATVDYNQNGIRPTFCAFNTFGVSLICCRDGSNILQVAMRTTTESRPIWGNANDGSRRISERKCDEYSRGVIEKVDYIPLLPEPETLSISAARCDYTGVELIVGGEDASQGEFPHMAAIGWANFQGGYSFFCGGSLISPRYVLSAGHCTDFKDTSLQDSAPAIVRLGDQNLDPTVNDGADPIDVPIRRTHKHPDYKPPVTYNDIALFELATDVKFNAIIRPACLWARADFGGHQKAVATGWGATATGPGANKSSKDLQKVSLSLLDSEYCNKLPLMMEIRNRNWLHGFQDSQLCAGELRGGKDSCQGDSGSPLQVASKDNHCIFHVVGVTSFGRGCGERQRPGIYSRVSSSLDWIERVVWPNE